MLGVINLIHCMVGEHPVRRAGKHFVSLQQCSLHAGSTCCNVYCSLGRGISHQ